MKIELNKTYLTPTKEHMLDFLRKADEMGLKWMSGRTPLSFVPAEYGENTCIDVLFNGIAYGNKNYLPSTCKFIEWEIENPKPTIIHLNGIKIVFNGDYTIVTDGRVAGKAKRNPADKYDAVVGLKLAVERYEKINQY